MMIFDKIKDFFSGLTVVDKLTKSLDSVFSWNPVTETIVVIFFVTIVTLSIFLMVALIKLLASRDIFLTLVKEGSAKAVMGVGDSGFHKFIMHFSGHRFKSGTWEVENKSSKGWKIWKFLGLSGVKYLGIPGLHTIHEYKFRWNSLKQSADDETTDAGGIYFKSHDDLLDNILLQDDIYYARIQGAEDHKMVPLDLDITLQIGIKDPYKALFTVQEWLEMTWGIYLPAIRRYVSTKGWQDLAGETEKHEKEFENSIKRAKDNLKDKFGVNVIEFRILRIKPGGARATMYETAATKEYEAERDAKVALIAAKAEQERIKTVFGEVEKYKELGLAIYKLEALVNSSKGPGNTIISAPELSNISAALGALIPKK